MQNEASHRCIRIIRLELYITKLFETTSHLLREYSSSNPTRHQNIVKFISSCKDKLNKLEFSSMRTSLNLWTKLFNSSVLKFNKLYVNKLLSPKKFTTWYHLSHIDWNFDFVCKGSRKVSCSISKSKLLKFLQQWISKISCLTFWFWNWYLQIYLSILYLNASDSYLNFQPNHMSLIFSRQSYSISRQSYSISRQSYSISRQS